MLVEESYRTASVENATMAVIVLNDDIRIDYSGDVEPEFGPGNQDSLIYAYFKRAVVKKIKRETNLSAAFYASYIEPKTYIPVVKEVSVGGSGVHEVKIPEKGTRYELGQPANFVLIIDKLLIRTSMIGQRFFSSEGTFVRNDGTAYHTFNPAGAYGSASFSPPNPPMFGYRPPMYSAPNKKLICESNILIWDNTNGALVAYGHVKTSTGSTGLPVVVMSTWEKLIDEYVKTIFEDTPFTHFDRSREFFPEAETFEVDEQDRIDAPVDGR